MSSPNDAHKTRTICELTLHTRALKNVRDNLVVSKSLKLLLSDNKETSVTISRIILSIWNFRQLTWRNARKYNRQCNLANQRNVPVTTRQKKIPWLTAVRRRTLLASCCCEYRFVLLLFCFGFLSGPFKRNMYDKTDESLYWKQSTYRFLKCTSTETLDKNKKTLILVFRCWHYKKNGQSLRKSFEVMNEMFIFNSFRIKIKYSRCCFIVFVLEIAVFTKRG